HSAKTKGSRSEPRRVNLKDSKIKRWNKPSDIPLDEEDEDRILLEGEDVVEDDEGDEDEVFALKGVSDNSDDDDTEEEDTGGDEDDIDDIHFAAIEAAEKAKKKGKGKKGKTVQEPESSAESESEEEGWGKSKSAYYSSNAAQIESDDEEANELEEQEAKRLQAKVRDDMGDDDFGLGDTVEVVAEMEEDTSICRTTLAAGQEALLRHIEKTNPEALALARDWDDVAHNLVKTQAKLARIESEDPNALSLSMVHLHYQALLTYTTTLAFYLHLRASEKYAQRPELLRSHPILNRLLALKQSLTTLEDLDFAASDDDEDDEDDEDESGSEVDMDALMADAAQLWGSKNNGKSRFATKNKSKSFDLEELEALLKEADEVMADIPSAADSKPKRKTKVREEEPPKKKRKTAKPAAPVFDLVEPDLSGVRKGKWPPHRTARRQTTCMERQAYSIWRMRRTSRHARSRCSSTRRKSRARVRAVRAHAHGRRAATMTSRIVSARGRRKRAWCGRLRRRVGWRDDLDDVEPEPKEAARERRDGETIWKTNPTANTKNRRTATTNSFNRKEKKKQEYEAMQEAARHEEDESVNGPRSLTRAILKNKGLTPHRSKSVRNPRVKKRQKYEKAKKRVASQKAVYKGGIGGTGRYDGEKSGISRVVKSVSL
ncbi:Something about silencing protein 10, partial [Grifola frondosa]